MARVLVTGGTKGIGLEITRLFLENGEQVVVLFSIEISLT
jgi:NAD(P)-dependent dehydrogenase (short-subunit alcohol dehydrogenase family)